MESAIRLILAVVWCVSPMPVEACAACESSPPAPVDDCACCAASVPEPASCCSAESPAPADGATDLSCSRRCQCCSAPSDATAPATRLHQDSPARTAAAAICGTVIVPPAHAVVHGGSEVSVAVNPEPSRARLCVWLD
jgi:hypothetical protein